MSQGNIEFYKKLIGITANNTILKNIDKIRFYKIKYTKVIFIEKIITPLTLETI